MEALAVRAEGEPEREEAFGRLVSTELPSTYRLAALILGDADEAQDAAQDALVKAWQEWDKLRDPERRSAWFGRIVVNVCRDRVRLRNRQRLGPAADPPSFPDPARATVERDAIWGALARLDHEQRLVVVLRYYLDLSLEDIAERTGSRVGTVKSRLHYALQFMRASYEADARLGEKDR